VVRLVAFLYQPLNEEQDRVRAIEGRLRRSTDTVFIPDLLVVPTEYGRGWRGRPHSLAIFSPPVPLVVEVWPESTGGYDVDAKVPDYRQRGDPKIWRIHPFERTLTLWGWQLDGTYRESVHGGGTIELAVLPGVTIGLARMFAS
jgi:Uma2 family endonuclease